MLSKKNTLRWYNNKDNFQTLEAMQEMVEFYHNNGNDMPKLGCTSHNLVNICLHGSTTAKFCQLTESNKNLRPEALEDMVGGPSKVFTRKAVVDNTHIRKSTIVFKSLDGIDASQATLIQNVNLCLQDSTLDLSLMQICNNSGQARKI